jgi:hypothetical protein
MDGDYGGHVAEVIDGEVVDPGPRRNGVDDL